MCLELLKLQSAEYTRFLAIQRIYRYVTTSPLFEEAYKLANNDERERIEKIIKSYNKDQLVTIVKNILRNHNKERCYYALNIQELKKMAEKLGISACSRMSKDQLLSAIDQTY